MRAFKKILGFGHYKKRTSPSQLLTHGVKEIKIVLLRRVLLGLGGEMRG